MRDSVRLEERSIADVVSDIGRNCEELLRCEIRLAQAEVRMRLAAATSAGTLILAGVLGALLGAFFLLLSALYALRPLMPMWAGALCIALLLSASGALVGGMGLRRLRERWRSPP